MVSGVAAVAECQARCLPTYVPSPDTDRRPGLSLKPLPHVTDLFTKLGLLSITWEPGYRPQNTAVLKAPAEQPLQIYLEWGKYDSGSPRGGWKAVSDA